MSLWHKCMGCKHVWESDKLTVHCPKCNRLQQATGTKEYVESLE